MVCILPWDTFTSWLVVFSALHAVHFILAFLCLLTFLWNLTNAARIPSGTIQNSIALMVDCGLYVPNPFPNPKKPLLFLLTRYFHLFRDCHVDGKSQRRALGLWRLRLQDGGGVHPWPSGVTSAAPTAESHPWWVQTAELSSALLQRAARLSPVWGVMKLIRTFANRFLWKHEFYIHLGTVREMDFCRTR